MKHIVLTGGGTAGHVTPNIALLPTLQKEGYKVHYIGSYDGIEKKLIEELNIPYYGISSGKLRRYFDPKNFSDPFKVIKGFFEAYKLLKKLNPNVVFSKGGFVVVPVILAAKMLKIPTVIHESDMTPGLATKIAMPSATKVCANFPETLKHLPKDKSVLTGTPIRKELFSGNRLQGLKFLNFTSTKPILLIMGGSTGSVKVNDSIHNILPDLLKDFQVVHLCGKDKVNTTLHFEGYRQFEYIKDELRDILACSNLVVSRAGANAICEILALRKPNILIPLSAASSRGDQILNAASFKKQGYSYVLEEELITNESLLKAIQTVYKEEKNYVEAMSSSILNDSIKTIVDIINDVAL